MENTFITKIASDLSISEKQIEQVLALTAEGNTIPFIARYRKEVTGNLDEVEIKAIIDLERSIRNLEERKETILGKIEEQGKLTDTLKASILASEKMAELEELYLPYKEKRRTKATIAREAGLFPLARFILQNAKNLEKEAENFLSENFTSPEAALAGAVDILVEALSEDTKLRSWTYNEIWNYSHITSTVKDQSLDDKEVFQIYYDFSDKISKMQGYRTLALNRGEKLGILKVNFEHNIDKMQRFYSVRFKEKNAYIEDLISQTLKKKLFQLWSAVSERN